MILLVARNEERRWLYPLLATMGSIAGTMLTFWMGRKAGEKRIDRYVPKKRLKALTAKIKNNGAVVIALLGIIQPPFPLTALVLAFGAF